MVDVGLTHVALEVADLDASIAFYHTYAAMQVVHRRPQVVWLTDKTRPFAIVLLQVTEVSSQLRPYAHLGVACSSRDEIDRLSALAREDERLIDGPTDSGPPVGYWAFFRDPDGHTLEVSYGQEVGATVVDGA